MSNKLKVSKCKDCQKYPLKPGLITKDNPFFCPVHDALKKERVKHEDLFRHRNKLCDCFKSKERKIKAWIIGSVILFEKPKYKSPFFPTEEVTITYKLN